MRRMRMLDWTFLAAELALPRLVYSISGNAAALLCLALHSPVCLVPISIVNTACEVAHHVPCKLAMGLHGCWSM